MSILKPAPIIELGESQMIAINMNIEDDFGFSKLQVAYEIHRPDYIEAEPKISIFNILIPDNEKNQQEIITDWNIGELGLMPDDEIHFHFETRVKRASMRLIMIMATHQVGADLVT